MPCALRHSALNMSSPLPSPSQLFGEFGALLPGDSDKNLQLDNLNSKSTCGTSIVCNVQLEIKNAPCGKQRPLLEDKVCLPNNLKMIPRFGNQKEQGASGSPIFRKPPSLESEEKHTEDLELLKENPPSAPQIYPKDVLPPKKSRRKRRRTEELQQSRIDKHQIRKPFSTKDVTKAKTFRPTKAPKEYRSPERLLSDAVAKKRAISSVEELEDLGLEKGIARKVDWTPTKNSAAPACTADLPSDEVLATTCPNPLFGHLVSGFEHAEQDGETVTGVQVMNIRPTVVAAKERKIDFINRVSAGSPAVKNQPKKAIKSKIQTITAKATEAFVIQDENSTPTLTPFFVPPPKQVIGSQTRRKQPLKNVKSKAKRKISSEEVSVLQSPETAMKASRDQAFVFVTSSQLIRDDSPDSPVFRHSGDQSAEPSDARSATCLYPARLMPQALKASTLTALSPTKSLWSAAARNDDSDLGAEYIELADTPEPEKICDDSTIPNVDSKLVNADLTPSNGVRQITGPMPSPDKDPGHKLRTNCEQSGAEVERVLPRPLAEKVAKARPKISSKKEPAAKSINKQMPNYEGFTNVQLKKALRSYHFKDVRDRQAMISLLRRCWENQKSKALQELDSNASIQQQPTEEDAVVDKTNEEFQLSAKPDSPKKKRKPAKAEPIDKGSENSPTDAAPKRKRGRPKKIPSESTPPVKPKRKAQDKSDPTIDNHNPEEIYDSDPPTPSPPRRLNSAQTATKTLTLSPSNGHGLVSDDITKRAPVPKTKTTSGGDLERERDRRLFFDAITRAVTSQPRTNDLKNPSWNEKILLYDPIIIEDLTAWLNGEGFAHIGKDDEVYTSLVKEWCESQSICCLMRENMRGYKRSTK